MPFLNLIEAIVSVLLCLSILFQQRASGLSQTFGGSGITYVQRRGAEKVLFRLSTILSVVFLGLAILQWYVPR